MGRIGMGEIVVVFFIVILLFGAKRLPEIGSSIGKAIREFKKVSKDEEVNTIGKDSNGTKS